MKKHITHYITSIFIAVAVFAPSAVGATSFIPVERTYYQDTAYGVQPITIVNNNVNNNTNTNVVNAGSGSASYGSAQGGASKVVNNYYYTTEYTYTPPKKTYKPTSKKSTSYKHLASAAASCTSCNKASYRLVNELECGATVALDDVKVPKPTCTLVPSITSTGAIELQWTTHGATVAFIDNGIGHVHTVTGKRVVTPTTDTAYNMTVMNDAGVAGSCGARVNVSMAKSGELSVLATQKDYAYTLNTTAHATTVGTDDTQATSGDNTIKAQSKVITNLKKIALPVGLVLFVLMLLLVLVMSKVKSAK